MSEGHLANPNPAMSVDQKEAFVARVAPFIKSPKTIAHREALSKALIGKMKGVLKSEEHKEKLRKPKPATHGEAVKKAALRRPKFPCHICGKLLASQHKNRHKHASLTPDAIIH